MFARRDADAARLHTIVNTEQRLMQVFMDVQRGLPRQGPGNDDSTLRALGLCAELPRRADILDVGCGPGMQTLALTRGNEGPVTAVDVYDEYLDELRTRAASAGVGERITVARADMMQLPFEDGAFDLIWAEGAAYIMGFDRAFSAWRKLLRAGGYVAVTELTWLVADPPSEVAAFFGAEYHAMTDIETNLASIRIAGYDIVDHFTLPDSAWWDDYYTPLEARLPGLREKYADDEAALAIVAAAEQEIEMRRRYADAYGYEFFIARLG